MSGHGALCSEADAGPGSADLSLDLISAWQWASTTGRIASFPLPCSAFHATLTSLASSNDPAASDPCACGSPSAAHTQSCPMKPIQLGLGD